MQSRISIELHRSRLLDALLIVAHAVAAACLALIPLPGTLRAVVLGFIALSVWRSLRRPVFSHLQLADSNLSQLSLTQGGGGLVDAIIVPETVVFPFLVALHLRDANNGRRLYTLLMPDQMKAEDYRRVRVWLRWRITDDAKRCVG